MATKQLKIAVQDAQGNKHILSDNVWIGPTAPTNDYTRTWIDSTANTGNKIKFKAQETDTAWTDAMLPVCKTITSVGAASFKGVDCVYLKMTVATYSLSCLSTFMVPGQTVRFILNNTTQNAARVLMPSSSGGFTFKFNENFKNRNYYVPALTIKCITLTCYQDANAKIVLAEGDPVSVTNTSLNGETMVLYNTASDTFAEATSLAPFVDNPDLVEKWQPLGLKIIDKQWYTSQKSASSSAGELNASSMVSFWFGANVKAGSSDINSTSAINPMFDVPQTIIADMSTGLPSIPDYDAWPCPTWPADSVYANGQTIQTTTGPWTLDSFNDNPTSTSPYICSIPFDVNPMSPYELATDNTTSIMSPYTGSLSSTWEGINGKRNTDAFANIGIMTSSYPSSAIPSQASDTNRFPAVRYARYHNPLNVSSANIRFKYYLPDLGEIKYITKRSDNINSDVLKNIQILWPTFTGGHISDLIHYNIMSSAWLYANQQAFGIPSAIAQDPVWGSWVVYPYDGEARVLPFGTSMMGMDTNIITPCLHYTASTLA